MIARSSHPLLAPLPSAPFTHRTHNHGNNEIFQPNKLQLCYASRSRMESAAAVSNCLHVQIHAINLLYNTELVALIKLTIHLFQHFIRMAAIVRLLHVCQLPKLIKLADFHLPLASFYISFSALFFVCFIFMAFKFV